MRFLPPICKLEVKAPPGATGLADEPAVFQRSLSAAGNYTVATSALGSAADTVLEIHNATSTVPLAQNDNIGPNNKASSVTYSFPSAGTYYIKVFGKQRGPNTQYTLSVQAAKGKK